MSWQLKKFQAANELFAVIRPLVAVGAYVVGIRSTRKAILNALLEPSAMVQSFELTGKHAQKLAMLEEFKTLPFGEVWDELCRRADVPVGKAWISDMEAYEESVLSER